jgi:serine/alanine adding enzyme
MALQVERFTGPADEWNAFASRQPGYTHFHRHEWRDIMRGVLRHETIYLAARDREGHLHAVMPLVRVKSRLFGHFLVSMPFLNYGGPLGTRSGIRAVVDAAVQLSGPGVKLLELRSAIPLPLSLPVSHRKITVILDVAGDADATFKAFDSKLRSQIRKPMKEGVDVLFGPDQVHGFYNVFARHMRDLGTPAQSPNLFSTIARVFSAESLFACAYWNGEPVAAGCGFFFGDEFELTWAASLKSANRIAPNMLLYWSLMRRCIDAGCQRFNFGRCTPGSGTHRFKMQWGGREQPLWWYAHSRSHEATTPSPDQGAYRWGPRVWRHLPVFLANFVGPRIVRLLP